MVGALVHGFASMVAFGSCRTTASHHHHDESLEDARSRIRHRTTSHDTPDFAADNLVRWWQRDGLERYRDASELLVLADSGGSNSPRIRCFKYALQTRLADPHHLKVTVCHYPSGASKWNPIDHRLFSEISKNWAGHPLRSYQTILNHIRTTTTDTGLCVTAQLVDQEYPKGVKISDAQFASIALEPHQIQPLRNYTIRPRS